MAEQGRSGPQTPTGDLLDWSSNIQGSGEKKKNTWTHRPIRLSDETGWTRSCPKWTSNKAKTEVLENKKKLSYLFNSAYEIRKKVPRTWKGQQQLI